MALAEGCGQKHIGTASGGADVLDCLSGRGARAGRDAVNEPGEHPRLWSAAFRSRPRCP